MAKRKEGVHLDRLPALRRASRNAPDASWPRAGADVLPVQVALLILASRFLALVGASLIGGEGALRPLERLGGSAP